MTRRYDFEQVDVFTQQRFRGNPLAVFTDATGLSKTHMQDIAREMNLSETTFVVPSERADCAARVYIFTPGMELPFAGHPTIGTAWVLARNGDLPKDANVVQLHENVGPITLRLEGPTDDPSALFLTAPPPKFGSIVENRAAMAAALNIDTDELLPDAPMQVVGVPVPFLYVMLRSSSGVDRVAVNGPALTKTISNPDLAGVFVFARQEQPNHVYSRMLGAEHVGVVEDPATGSASGSLGAYLVQHGLVSGNGSIDVLSEQGTKMGRQSFVSIRIERAGGQVKRIEVGGSVVPVLRGSLEIDT
ncbi:MAG TPA: PhzF family phenazine biosynthesis protein [Candidatus Eremiobacteraceae bacterium]|nr:PhzF family phenazine biosynthesis protein [Candidatus Eremiobacteraceae bacterium]